MKTSVILSVLLMALVLVGCGGSESTPGEEAPAEGETEASSGSVVMAAEKDPGTGHERYAAQVIETAEVMKLMVDPAYERLKDAIEVAPEGRKAWRALYIESYSLAELNNLLYSRFDEKKEYYASEEYIEQTDIAAGVLLTFAESVKGQADYEVLKKDYLALVNNCNQCHRLFEPGEIDEIVPPESWGMETEEDPAKVSFQ